MRLNPFAGLYLTDPASMWRRILDDPDGVHYAEDLGLWLISRHAHVRRALADATTFANALTLAPVYEVCPSALNVIMQIDAPPTTAAADAPAHPRTRRALRATFANTAERVEAEYGAIIRRRVDQLVSRLAARQGDQVDLIPEFATELPCWWSWTSSGCPTPTLGASGVGRTVRSPSSGGSRTRPSRYAWPRACWSSGTTARTWSANGWTVDTAARTSSAVPWTTGTTTTAC
ncbi:hypothetical protein [Micromonospora arida]